MTGIDVKGVEDAKKAGKWFLDHGTGTAIITLGEKGTVVVTPEFTRHYLTPEVKALDTTGAGDIFSGAFMAAMSQGTTIDDSVVFANHAAALSTKCLGVVEAIPDLEDVEDFLRNSPLKNQ